MKNKDIEPRYVFEIEPRISTRIDSSLRKILQDNKPNFGCLDQRVRVVDIKDEGASFEPRIRVFYDVWLSGVQQERYDQLLILDEKSDEVVAML